MRLPPIPVPVPRAELELAGALPELELELLVVEVDAFDAPSFERLLRHHAGEVARLYRIPKELGP